MRQDRRGPRDKQFCSAIATTHAEPVRVEKKGVGAPLRNGHSSCDAERRRYKTGSCMSRSGLALTFAAFLFTTPLLAHPLSRSCDYKGEGKLGPLLVDFDAASRSVTVKTHDGQIWRYRDGVLGRIAPNSVKDDPGPVQQFVKVWPDRVEVGFRWPDDNSMGHMAYFDPKSFTNPSKRCLWKSLWDFAMG